MTIQFLNTPAHTDIERLRSDAKKRTKKDGIPLAKALDAVALEATGASTWSTMMSDHVVSHSDSNTLTFAITSPDNTMWNVNAQLSVSVSNLRDAMMSGRTLSCKAIAYGSKRRRGVVKVTVGTRDMTFGSGGGLYTLSDAVADEVRGNLLSPSSRLRAGAAFLAIKSMLADNAGIWRNVVQEQFSAIIIDPVACTITDVTHDGTYRGFVEALGMSSGHNLIAEVLDDDGLVAIHLPEKFARRDGISLVGERRLTGRVVLISRNPDTGFDRDLPQALPALSFEPGKAGPRTFSFTSMDDLDPETTYFRRPDMSGDANDYPFSQHADGPIKLTMMPDLTRVTSTQACRGRTDDTVFELSSRGGSDTLRIGTITDSGYVNEAHHLSVEGNGKLTAQQILNGMESMHDDTVLKGHWLHRGISIDETMLADPVTSADIVIMRDQRDAGVARQRLNEKALAECDRIVVGGNKGDWVTVPMGAPLLRDMGLTIDTTSAPNIAPAGYMWTVLVAHDLPRAAMLTPSTKNTSDISQWVGSGILHVGGLDGAWTYAASIAEYFVSLHPDKMVPALTLAQSIVRRTDDIPDFDIFDHLGLNPDGTRHQFDMDPLM